MSGLPAQRLPGAGPWRARLVRPVVEQLTQGLSPGSIALTVAVGLCLAVIPVVGATTVLCVTAAVVLRLNQPLIQAINYFSFPLQLALLVPYLHLGRVLFGGPPLTLTASQLVAWASAHPGEAAAALGAATLRAVGAWVLTAPLAGLLLFLVARPLLAALARRLRRGLPATGDRAA